MNEMGDTRLDLLLFTVSGIHFGVDAEQISGMAGYDGTPSDDLHWFHEELEFGASAGSYLSPTIVTVKTGNDASYRVIIDAMEDISDFSPSDIHLFPPLLEPFAVRKGMWGILVRNGHMVLLVDFQLLLKHTRHEIF